MRFLFTRRAVFRVTLRSLAHYMPRVAPIPVPSAIRRWK